MNTHKNIQSFHTMNDIQSKSDLNDQSRRIHDKLMDEMHHPLSDGLQAEVNELYSDFPILASQYNIIDKVGEGSFITRYHFNTKVLF